MTQVKQTESCWAWVETQTTDPKVLFLSHNATLLFLCVTFMFHSFQIKNAVPVEINCRDTHGVQSSCTVNVVYVPRTLSCWWFVFWVTAFLGLVWNELSFPRLSEYWDHTDDLRDVEALCLSHLRDWRPVGCDCMFHWCNLIRTLLPIPETGRVHSPSPSASVLSLYWPQCREYMK